MEEQIQSQSSSLFGLTIDLNSKVHLSEAARWTKFLAIAGFIFIGLMILYGFLMPEFMRSSISRFPNEEPRDFPVSMFRTIMMVYMLIFGAIYFFPCYFILRFSNFMKDALNTNSQEKLVSAFQNLKITVRYLGVLTIIFLGLAVLGSLIFIITMLTMPQPIQ